MTDRLEIKAAFAVDDAGTITGTAWPFNAGPDAVGDLIERGAFQPSAALPILYEHDGGKAIGTWETIEETEAGLQVKGRLFLDSVPLARDVHRQLKTGRVSGLSIGFRALESKTRADGNRTIISLHLAEISIVANPSHRAARILEVKTAGDAATPIQKENTLDPELKNEPEVKSDPVIDAKTFETLKARLDKLEAKSSRPHGANNNQPVGENDNLETKAFETLLRRGEKRLGADEIKTLTVANDGAAGYLAPSEYGSEILKKLTEWSPVRQYARVVNVSGRDVKYPRKVSGTSAFWVGETDDRTASEMAFEQITITPHELATFTDISNQLLEDNTYDLRGELIADYSEAFGKTEASAFVTGNGTGRPRGIMTAGGIAEIKTGNAGTLGTDPAATIIGMFHALPSVHAQNGVWMLNRKTLAALRTLKDGNGRFILVDPIASGMPTTLLGRPIVEAIDMADVAAGAFPILFGDLQGYRIVNRLDLNILPDPYTLAAKGQVRFHARARVGADVTNPDRFVKLKVAA